MIDIVNEVEPVTHLAYVEQIPKEKKIHLVCRGEGQESPIEWLLSFFQDAQYQIDSIFLQTPIDLSSLTEIPVHSFDTLMDNTSKEDAFVLISPEPNSTELTQHFSDYSDIFEATQLYFFIHASCKSDNTHILVEDLSMCRDKITKKQLQEYGKLWRTSKRLPTHQYVRNIEKNMGEGSKFVVNIGTHDGVTGDPCYPLIKDGWGGWGVDGIPVDCELAQEAKRNLNFPNFSLTLGQYATPYNIASLLSNNLVPKDPDIIKIDIDSYDGPVIQKILESGYLPRVFCIEVNACFPPPFKFSVNYDHGGNCVNGGKYFKKPYSGNIYNKENEKIAHTSELKEAIWDKATFDGKGRCLNRLFASIGLYGCSVSWAADLFEKFGYSFARYEFGFPQLIGGIRDMIFIRNDVYEASEATPNQSYEDAYYAEPLGWSHIQSALGLDPRKWRHAENPEQLVDKIYSAIDSKLNERFHSSILPKKRLSKLKFILERYCLGRPLPFELSL